MLDEVIREGRRKGTLYTLINVYDPLQAMFNKYGLYSDEILSPEQLDPPSDAHTYTHGHVRNGEHDALLKDGIVHAQSVENMLGFGGLDKDKNSDDDFDKL